MPEKPPVGSKGVGGMHKVDKMVLAIIVGIALALMLLPPTLYYYGQWILYWRLYQ